MGKYTYTVNTSIGAQDNGTYANKRIFTIKACENTLIANNLSDLWNENLCAQDEAYCQPWVPGDKLYFQFRNDRDESSTKIIDLINKDTGEIISSTGMITTEEGVDAEGTSYYNVIIDTTNLEICCFYMRLTSFFCDVDPTLLANCITDATSPDNPNPKTLAQATYDCMVQLCNEENIEEIFTEPYCRVICEETVLIEGTYPKYDCDLNYYGLFDSDYFPTNSYKCQVRVMGEINKQSYNITETILNEEKQASKMNSVYKLLTPKIPPYVANQIANCFNAQHLYIDGVEYKRGVVIEKNNDVGNMWIINTDLQRICDTINFLCE